MRKRFLRQIVFHLIRGIAIFDLHCLFWTVRFVLWMRKMNIAQRAIERNAIGLWLALNIAWICASKDWFYSVIVVIGAALLIHWHRGTVQSRLCMTGDLSWVLLRAFLLPVLTLMSAINLHFSARYDVLLTGQDFLLMFLYYIFGVNFFDDLDEKKGKLSWEKVKELFGTDWVTVPTPQENG